MFTLVYYVYISGVDEEIVGINLAQLDTILKILTKKFRNKILLKNLVVRRGLKFYLYLILYQHYSSYFLKHDVSPTTQPMIG